VVKDYLLFVCEEEGAVARYRRGPLVRNRVRTAGRSRCTGDWLLLVVFTRLWGLRLDVSLQTGTPEVNCIRNLKHKTGGLERQRKRVMFSNRLLAARGNGQGFCNS
jgi:hypothetical protein